jgi:hypothetical protein
MKEVAWISPPHCPENGQPLHQLISYKLHVHVNVGIDNFENEPGSTSSKNWPSWLRYYYMPKALHYHLHSRCILSSFFGSQLNKTLE